MYHLTTVLAIITNDANIVKLQLVIFVTIIEFYVNGPANIIDGDNHGVKPVTVVLFATPLATHPHAAT